MADAKHRRATMMTSEEKHGPEMLAKRHKQALRVVKEAEQFMDGGNPMYNPGTAAILLEVAKDLDSNVKAMWAKAKQMADDGTTAAQAQLERDGLKALASAATAALVAPLPSSRGDVYPVDEKQFEKGGFEEPEGDGRLRC
jgi:hypothetical protein